MNSYQTSKWEWVAFEDAVEICDYLRKPVNSKERAQRVANKREDELYPYYGATGQVGYIDSYLSDGEYVLLGEDGAPFLDPFAKKAYLIKGKGWVNNHAHVLKSKLNNEFLCYYLNQVDYNGLVTGTTRYKLTQAAMKRILVPTPDLVEQERIVSKIEELFSKLDASVAELKTAKEKLKVYRQAVLKEAFDSVRSDCMTTTIKSVCETIKVGIVIKPTQYYVKTDGVFAFRNANVRRNYIEDNDWAMISQEGHQKNLKSQVHTDDVLIARSGVNLGMAAAVPEKYDGYNAIDIVIAVPKKNFVLPKYLAQYTNSPYGVEIVKKNQHGAAQGHLNVKEYGNLPIFLPNISVQNELLQKIESRLSVCDSIEQTIDTSLQQAEALRQSILKQAFEGRLIE